LYAKSADYGEPLRLQHNASDVLLRHGYLNQ